MNAEECTAILSKLQSQQNLTDVQMRETIGWFLTGEADPEWTRQVLMLLAEKGESADELIGAAQALRNSMLRVETDHSVLVDTCGTGGDGSKTFNISTAAAIVTAAAGIPVAKHGNRKVTSSTGSADVLAELGIHLEAGPAVVEKCLKELGICFCFAPHYHPAMRHVGPIRKEIGIPTIFNRLGPLANPAGANHQVLGIGNAELQHTMAEALQALGTSCSVVVRGEDGVDEVSLSAPTRVLEVTPMRILEHQWTPETFGLARADRGQLFADSPTESADCIRRVLSAQPGPMYDVVALNAAAAIWIARGGSDADVSPSECSDMAKNAIDSGKARQLVNLLGEMTANAAG